jgi:hypothetical protein
LEKGSVEDAGKAFGLIETCSATYEMVDKYSIKTTRAIVGKSMLLRG